MKAIWKFQFEINDTVRITMPKGADILKVECQGDNPCIWALVDPQGPTQEREFHVYGTGHPISDPTWLIYVGTFQQFGGRFVWHLFESCTVKQTKH